MMVWKFLCLCLTAVCFPLSTLAATFTTACDTKVEKNGGCTIILTGEIVKGDNQRLIDFLRSKKSVGQGFYRRILLNSAGGSISEAILISQTVIDNVLDTATHAYWRELNDQIKSSNTYCVSACFLIWIAGAERHHYSRPPKFGNPPTGLGLHRPYSSKEEFSNLTPSAAAKAQQDLVSQVRSYLKRNDVPDHLIDEMLRRSSKEVYWLDTWENPDELAERAAWFEELMISRCAYDPEFARRVNSFGAPEVITGKQIPQEQKDKYFAWRQNYNVCEYEFRKNSQVKFLAAK